MVAPTAPGTVTPEKTAPLSARGRRLLHYVRRNPGAVLRDLREMSGLGWGTFYLVLHELEEARLVRTKRQGRARFVYPAEMRIPREPQADHLAPSTRRVALHIIRRPGMDMHLLMEEAGLSTRMAYHHVRRLVEGGFVETEAEGKYRGLRPTAKLFRLLGLDA